MVVTGVALVGSATTSEDNDTRAQASTQPALPCISNDPSGCSIKTE